jgi:hypothetical protein
VPNGKGIYYFADGDRFVGVFKNGQPTREGKMYNGSGAE